MESVTAVIDEPSEEWTKLTLLLSRNGYSVRMLESLENLESLMNETDSRVVLLDLDAFPADNRFFRSLKAAKPDSSIFVVSRRPFHPELKEAMSTHICACFRKPLDGEEFLFWLKAVSREPRDRDPTGEPCGGNEQCIRST
jgi:DNA-binding NtrC family response regulator